MNNSFIISLIVLLWGQSTFLFSQTDCSVALENITICEGQTFRLAFRYNDTDGYLTHTMEWSYTGDDPNVIVQNISLPNGTGGLAKVKYGNLNVFPSGSYSFQFTVDCADGGSAVGNMQVTILSADDCSCNVPQIVIEETCEFEDYILAVLINGELASVFEYEISWYQFLIGPVGSGNRLVLENGEEGTFYAQIKDRATGCVYNSELIIVSQEEVENCNCATLPSVRVICGPNGPQYEVLYISDMLKSSTTSSCMFNSWYNSQGNLVANGFFQGFGPLTYDGIFMHDIAYIEVEDMCTNCEFVITDIPEILPSDWKECGCSPPPIIETHQECVEGDYVVCVSVNGQDPASLGFEVQWTVKSFGTFDSQDYSNETCYSVFGPNDSNPWASNYYVSVEKDGCVYHKPINGVVVSEQDYYVCECIPEPVIMAVCNNGSPFYQVFYSDGSSFEGTIDWFLDGQLISSQSSVVITPEILSGGVLQAAIQAENTCSHLLTAIPPDQAFLDQCNGSDFGFSIEIICDDDGAVQLQVFDADGNPFVGVVNWLSDGVPINWPFPTLPPFLVNVHNGNLEASIATNGSEILLTAPTITLEDRLACQCGSYEFIGIPECNDNGELEVQIQLINSLGENITNQINEIELYLEGESLGSVQVQNGSLSFIATEPGFYSFLVSDGLCAKFVVPGGIYISQEEIDECQCQQQPDISVETECSDDGCVVITIESPTPGETLEYDAISWYKDGKLVYIGAPLNIKNPSDSGSFDVELVVGSCVYYYTIQIDPVLIKDCICDYRANLDVEIEESCDGDYFMFTISIPGANINSDYYTIDWYYNSQELSGSTIVVDPSLGLGVGLYSYSIHDIQCDEMYVGHVHVDISEFYECDCSINPFKVVKECIDNELYYLIQFENGYSNEGFLYWVTDFGGSTGSNQLMRKVPSTYNFTHVHYDNLANGCSYDIPVPAVSQMEIEACADLIDPVSPCMEDLALGRNDELITLQEAQSIYSEYQSPTNFASISSDFSEILVVKSQGGLCCRSKVFANDLGIGTGFPFINTSSNDQPIFTNQLSLVDACITLSFYGIHPVTGDCVKFHEECLKRKRVITPFGNGIPNSGFKIWPNPMRESTHTLNVGDVHELNEIQILDFNGQVIANWKNPSSNLDLNQPMAEGIYWVLATTKDGSIKYSKLLVLE